MAFIEINSYRYNYAGFGTDVSGATPLDKQEREYALDIEHLSVERGEMVLLIGHSGCGKTTFLRRLAGEKGLRGEEQGEIVNDAKSYGYVWQEPGAQMVCDKVEHEIVFGMENHSFTPEKMYRRLAEMTAFFGLEQIVHKNVYELSAGQQQKVSIAGAVAMNPDLLLLDEPTGMLDPVAAEDLIGLVEKIRDELGTTIVIAEQRAGSLMRKADRIVYMEDGKVLCNTTPEELYRLSEEQKGKLYPYMSEPMAIAIKNEATAEVYLNNRELRNWFEKQDDAATEVIQNLNITNKYEKSKIECIISAREIYYYYKKTSGYAVKDCSFELQKGSVTCLVGGNGSGKTTLAQLLAGLMKPTSGKVKYTGITKSDIAYLPSDPRYLFEEIIDKSVGERKWIAINKIFEKDASVYILDEPTAGLDPERKEKFADAITEKKSTGKTILIITHDMEFAAKTADCISMMYDGRVVATDSVGAFLAENTFFTTELRRVIRSPHF
ncbi:MAG: ATP-binding cassette domain-containing protein [Eubacterium sp.]|nr:ATP-binding cassette domain-containing protein [Eubacterium sp.]